MYHGCNKQWPVADGIVELEVQSMVELRALDVWENEKWQDWLESWCWEGEVDVETGSPCRVNFLTCRLFVDSVKHFVARRRRTRSEDRRMVYPAHSL